MFETLQPTTRITEYLIQILHCISYFVALIHYIPIQSKDSLEKFWIPMSLLNVWRIPILFFISGMGVFFAIQKRNWIALMLERTRRILIPLIVGYFLIVPIHVFIFQKSGKFEIQAFDMKAFTINETASVVISSVFVHGNYQIGGLLLRYMGKQIGIGFQL